MKVAADGTVSVPLRGLHKMSAYRIVLTPGGTGTPTAASVPWSASYEAEDAAITDGKVYTQGTVGNANGYAASGTKDVGSLNTATSKVDFTVDVPVAGTYDLAILYGNQSGTPATQKLSIDGQDPVTVTYPSTENWTYRAKKDITVDLPAGRHVLTLSKGDAEVTLDRIDLTARTSAAPSASYEATLADISGRPSYDYSSSAGVGTGALVLRSGDKAVFDVYAPRDGYYTVVPRASAAVNVELHGQKVTAAPGKDLRLYLVAGNNRIALTAKGPPSAPSTSRGPVRRPARSPTRVPRPRSRAVRSWSTPSTRPAVPTSGGSATARPARPSSRWRRPSRGAICWSCTTRTTIGATTVTRTTRTSCPVRRMSRWGTGRCGRSPSRTRGVGTTTGRWGCLLICGRGRMW